MRRAVSVSPVSLIITWLTLSGCQAVLSLNDFQVDDAQVASSVPAYSCRAHSECPPPAGPPTATFCTTKRRCAQLQNEECSRVAGSEADPNALVLGAMFATSGADAPVELARLRAVQLAVEEINERGGIPVREGGKARSLLLIGCDASANLERAATHLGLLGARAIVGLTDSEQLLQVVRTQAIAAGMVTMSLAIAPESINSLLDADLAWLMALTVEQRAPLLDTALSALEQLLRAQRSAPLRLALMFRFDGAGRAGLSVLRSHELDGIPLGVPERHAGRIRIDPYPVTPAEQESLLAAYRGFAPDIIVMLGPVDSVGAFMAPLEQSLERDAVGVRPHYMLTEAAKGPALIDLAHLLPSLRERIHGVGAAIPTRNRPVWEAFQRRYVARFSDELSAAPRVAAAYDATYALAYAIASIEPDHEVGGRIAQALHWLEAPAQTAAPVFDVGPDALAMSFGRLNGAERIGVNGAAGDLNWDGYGALQGGTLEVWCMEAGSGAIRYGSAPLTFDIATQRFGSRSAACDAWLKPLSEMRGLDMDVQADARAQQMAARAGAQDAGAAEPSAVDEAGAAGSSAANAGAGASGAASEAMSTMTKTLACGSTSCVRGQEQCCIATLGALPGTVDSETSCQPLVAEAPTTAGAAGMAAPAACALRLQCASTADCGPGNVCCANAQLASCKPEAACNTEQGRRLACKTPAECPGGLTCCLHSDASSSSFATSACEPTCDLASGGVRLCATDADCANDPTSTACNPSVLLPVARACWPRL